MDDHRHDDALDLSQMGEVTIERLADSTTFWVHVLEAGRALEGIDELKFRYEERDGTLVCTGLHLLTSNELTARGLHDLRFGALRDLAVEWAALQSDAKPPRMTAERRRGSRGHPDAFYEEVAEQYRYAVRHHPARPIQWMTDQRRKAGEYVSAETVRSWVRKARAKGHLGSGVQGKAGERSQP